MIDALSHEIKEIRLDKISMAYLYKGTQLLWQALNDCFSSGAWINKLPWRNDSPWKN